MNDMRYERLQAKLFDALEGKWPTVNIDTEDLSDMLAQYKKSENITPNTYGEWANLSLGIGLGAMLVLLSTIIFYYIAQGQ